MSSEDEITQKLQLKGRPLACVYGKGASATVENIGYVLSSIDGYEKLCPVQLMNGKIRKIPWNKAHEYYKHAKSSEKTSTRASSSRRTATAKKVPKYDEDDDEEEEEEESEYENENESEKVESEDDSEKKDEESDIDSEGSEEVISRLNAASARRKYTTRSSATGSVKEKLTTPKARNTAYDTDSSSSAEETKRTRKSYTAPSKRQKHAQVPRKSYSTESKLKKRDTARSSSEDDEEVVRQLSFLGDKTKKKEPKKIRKGGGRRAVGRWTEEETEFLIFMVEQYGAGSWKTIIREGKDVFQQGRTNVDIKDKWRGIERRLQKGGKTRRIEAKEKGKEKKRRRAQPPPASPPPEESWEGLSPAAMKATKRTKSSKPSPKVSRRAFTVVYGVESYTVYVKESDTVAALKTSVCETFHHRDWDEISLSLLSKTDYRMLDNATIISDIDESVDELIAIYD